MNFKYFTSLPSDSDALKVAYEMIFKGFPMLFIEGKESMVNLFTPDPEKALDWVFDNHLHPHNDWVVIAFTTYYNDNIEKESHE